MFYTTLALALTSVLISAVAQMTLKLGMSRPSMRAALAEDGFLPTALAVITSPEVVAGLALYGFGAVLWLFVLAKFDLSVAYPFVGLGFIFTMVFAILFLGENVTVLRAGGTLLIVAGCILVARSA